MASTAGSAAARALGIVRNWWPVPAFLAAVLAAQAAWSARYDVAGHAADHLQSATAVFAMVFLSSVLVWALPPRARRDPLLWLLTGATVAAAFVVMAGNLRVVAAIGGETWSDAQAAALGPDRPGFASGHDLAGFGAWVAVAATVLLAGLLWARRLVGVWIAVAATALSLLVPSFIVPGAGIVVLAVAAAVGRARQPRT
jgi:hypothetical protein